MQTIDIEREMWGVINSALAIGPGYAQEGYVLRTTWEKLGKPNTDKEQQQILDVWQGLVRDGKVVWGYDIANPSAPFFHKPVN